MNVPQQQPAPPVAAAVAAPQLALWEIKANALNLQGEHRLLH